MLAYYKSIYKHETVPMIVEIDELGNENFIEGILILSRISPEKILKQKFVLLMERAEYDFEISVEYTNGANSY